MMEGIKNMNMELTQIKRGLKKEQSRLRTRRFLNNRLAVVGCSIMLLIILLAVFAPAFYTAGPYEMVVADRLQAPSGAHLLGTDTFGRDLLSRIAYGARISLMIGAAVTVISTVSGIIVGIYASYYKALDNVLMRVCDGLNAIPAMLLAIALMAVLGSSIFNVVLSLSIVYMPSVARIARSAALSVKEQTYIEAMRALGASSMRIICLHILPNILSPVIVQASFIFARTIVTEAALSFLGVGVTAPTPSWGNILYEGKTAINKAWWLIVFPGATTAASVLGLNLIGDGLRDALDPHSK